MSIKLGNKFCGIINCATNNIFDYRLNGFRKFNIHLSSSDDQCGNVHGGGIFTEGQSIEISAIPRHDCSFDVWSDGNHDNVRDLTLDKNYRLVAYFRCLNNLIMKGISGTEYKYDAVNSPISGNLVYVNMGGKVQSPFSQNQELSVNDNLVEVNDVNGEISSIGDWAFGYCTSLSSIGCPNVSSIGGYSFVFTSITSISCPNVISIGEWAFNGCTSLSSIDCHNVSSIGEGVFQFCTSLSSINCRNVSYIGPVAFKECTSLKSVNISAVNQVTQVQLNSFESCTYPISVYLSNDYMVEQFEADLTWKQLEDDGQITFVSVEKRYLTTSSNKIITDNLNRIDNITR